MGALSLGLLLAAAPAAQADLSTSPDATYQTNGRVWAIVTVGNVVYVGGNFTSVRPAGDPLGTGEVPRAYLAAFTTSGQLLPWAPQANGQVMSLAASPDGSAIYAGGGFGTMNGKGRQHFAALDASSGALVSGWGNFHVNGAVQALAASASEVYLGGKFTSVAYQPRQRLAAIDTPAATGGAAALDASWTPSAQDVTTSSGTKAAQIYTLAFDPYQPGGIFVGGYFSTLNAWSGHRYLDAVDTTTGQTSFWAYHPGYPVYGVVPAATQVYFGGNGAGGTVQGIDRSTQSASKGASWTLKTDGGVQAIALIGPMLYAGGHFDNVCNDISATGPPYKCTTSQATRHKIFAVDAASGALSSWYPGADSNLGIFAMAVANDAGGPRLEIGGDFTKTGNASSLGYATTGQQGYAQYSALP